MRRPNTSNKPESPATPSDLLPPEAEQTPARAPTAEEIAKHLAETAPRPPTSAEIAAWIAANPQSGPVVSEHEEPEKPLSERRFEMNGYEYILVQVTQQDRYEGRDQSIEMRQARWTIVDIKAEPDWDTGNPDYFAMKRPKSISDKKRRAAEDQYMTQMYGPTGGFGGSGLEDAKETVEREQFTAAEEPRAIPVGLIGS